MEEKLKECLLHWNRVGSPDTFRDNTLKSFCNQTASIPFQNPEYLIARLSGLTIAEASDALMLAEEIRHSGIERVLAKLEALGQKIPSVSVAKRPRKNKKSKNQEPKLKKMQKL
ncbi:unnamed protein product [Blepharisma stoltei]|uniref:Uncharacterized protein n=1 Tax=Blepharisma stoltei TaxID=1481888 RepID=A0AAU9K4S1_9CILI|nr:unnamed protein product [Blepharisma stoltei]